METFDARFHSFSKRKSKSSAKWPHPDSFVANPTSLAEAGFFFKPSKDDPDNVQCFLCKKQLGCWDEEDNPFEVHVKKSPKCPWAIARCSLEFDVDSDGHFSITDDSRRPTNKVLEKARADTFGGKKWWPHDAIKNHGAASKKMAKAGFVYTPQAQGDDTATCFYCNLSLSGWDAEDDPNEEHIKRVERAGKPCPFFETTTERPKSQASTRSTKTNSRKSKAPKGVEVKTDDENGVITVKASASTKKRKQKQPDPSDPPSPPKTPKTPEGQIMQQDSPKGNPDATDLHATFQVPQSPANFFVPPLANTPVQVIAALTEEERAMTVEQWIRHEMAVQYQRLKEDGEGRIRVFLEQAEETRRRIEAL